MRAEFIATLFFALALVHSFCAPLVARLSVKFKKLHIFSEVEFIFGFWALLFLFIWSVTEADAAVAYFRSLSMTEPVFIFGIMMVASTRPVVTGARYMILKCSSGLQRLFGMHEAHAQIFCLLFVGPLLGSLVTEPAAITITALLLYRMMPDQAEKNELAYPLLAFLFVNVSVGGALTHFAAPPILMVSRVWGWGFQDVLWNLGLPAVAAVFLNSLLFLKLYRKKIVTSLNPFRDASYPVPVRLILIHLCLMGGLVRFAHEPLHFGGFFLLFLAVVFFTRPYQDGLKFRESGAVAFFLAGLIVFGPMQTWWLDPLLRTFSELSLFLGATLLTAVTDNAALTFLGSQVAGLSVLSKWALVAGALAGGGLTILANAPNPAGFSILSSRFPRASLNAWKLFKAALLPTVVALLCFYIRLFIAF